ncbi:MAG: DUF1592 domain-containing protein [Myxococcales bacterium FL481]|nr:MAG: DUF1592 domain-containing protein [Myxococcales bacterium FL481]
MFRLTHAQWDNTVRDLLRRDDSFEFAADFRDDPYQSGFLFDNNFSALSVDSILWDNYRGAAGQVAAAVVADEDILDAIVPGGAVSDDEQAAAFVEEFGSRAFRRPLTTAERDAYLELFDEAPGLYPDTQASRAGIQFVVEAMLQSPHFLYRIERSDDDADGLVPLTSYELASRLSYLLWNSMPDDVLLAAARDDELTDPDELERHARRLLESERAAETVAHFHRQLFELDNIAAAAPSQALFPDTSSRFGEYAQTEAELFLNEVVFSDDGGIRELLLSPKTFVNAELARVYGLSGDYDDDFEPVTLDDERRAGLFTQLGFLAANATSAQPDPIHRGVFMAERVACKSIPAPPDDITPLPSAEGRTNREVVEAHTEDPDTVCAACHATTINPFGFPFENYDASGAWRDRDNGHDVDASSEVRIGDDVVAVDHALDLVTALASSATVHRCYAQHLIEFATGRPAEAQDEGWAARLGDQSFADTLSVQDLLVELIRSPAFTHRSAQELE